MNSNLEEINQRKGFHHRTHCGSGDPWPPCHSVAAGYDKLMKGREEIAKIQIKELEGALQLYAFDMGRYPNSAEGLEALVRNVSNSSAWNGPYLSKKELPRDPWDEPYKYRCPGLHGDFDLFSTGPDGADGGDDDICNWK